MRSVGLLIIAIVFAFILTAGKTSAQSVSGTAVKSAIENYVKQSLPVSEETVLEFKDLKESYPVNFGGYHLSVSSANSVTLKGLVTFLVKARPASGKNLSQIIPVTVKIRTFERALVTTKMIQPHGAITSDEVASVRTETTDLPNPVTSLSQLNGKWTSRWVQEGKALTFDMFDDMPIVKRGDDVMIIYRTKNIIVRDQGSALQDGRLNDVIRVTNEYKDNLRAKVIGKDEVVLMN